MLNRKGIREMNRIQPFQKDRRIGVGVSRSDAPHRQIGEALLRIGIEPHLCGFDTLSDGIRITAERELRFAPFRTHMEPTLGSLNGTAGWEHMMRDAIRAGFLNADEVQAKLFPYTDRPGNAEFVCTLAAALCDRIASKKDRLETPIEGR